MAVALIAVGSNVEPMRHVPRGLRRLDRVARIRASSRFYRTPAVGADGLHRIGDPDFVNGMVQVETSLSPLALRRLLHGIEADAGRVRTADRHAPRELDLDIVLHGDRVLDGDLPLRRHLAVCLLELRPGFELAPGTPLRDPGGLPMAVVPGLDLAILEPPPRARI